MKVPEPGAERTSGKREDHPRAYHEPRQNLGSRHTPDLPTAAGPATQGPGRWRCGGRGTATGAEGTSRGKARATGSKPTPTSSKVEAMVWRVRPEAGAAAVHRRRQEEPNTPPANLAAPAASYTDPARLGGPPSARDGSGTFARLRLAPPRRT